MLTYTFFNVVVVFLKMLFGFLITKYIAISGGPAAMAYFGQVQSAVTIFQNLPAGVANGIIASTPNWKEKGKLDELWNSAMILGIGLFVFFAISLYLSKEISSLFFMSDDFSEYYIFLVLSFPFYYIYGFCNAVNTSQEKFSTFFSSNITSMLLYITLMAILKFYFNIGDIYLWLILFIPFCSIFVLVFTLLSNDISIPKNLDIGAMKTLSRFFILSLVSVIFTPLTIVFIRNIITINLGDIVTGNWQAMWRISEIYTSIIMLSISTIILPKFANTKTKKDVFSVFKSAIVFVFPIYITAMLILNVFYKDVFGLLYSDVFKIDVNALRVQLLGDFFKIVCWLITYYLLSQSKLLLLFCFEIIFGLSFILLSWVNLDFGIFGISTSYLIIQFTCSVCLFYYLLLFLNRKYNEL